MRCLYASYRDLDLQDHHNYDLGQNVAYESASDLSSTPVRLLPVPGRRARRQKWGRRENWGKGSDQARARVALRQLSTDAISPISDILTIVFVVGVKIAAMRLPHFTTP